MGLMSDETRGPGRSEGGGEVSKRVGTAERDQAIAVLDEHWHAGRLDPGEHELRVTRAKAAVTQRDLDALFIDLPKPRAASRSTDVVASGDARGVMDRKRETIMALTPFIALALFFTTGFNWLWFLAIPVMGILVYGPDGGKNAGRGRGKRRHP
jgi:hypothetical protein